ncbi:MAG: Rho termination factor N-terminal domain-containing protein, partial [Solirubrobacteraceae bacterium]
MSVLDRASLEQSPLADLHAVASELSIDGYRRLRRAELINAIVARQEGATEAPADATDDGSVEREESTEESTEAPSAGRRRG